MAKLLAYDLYLFLVCNWFWHKSDNDTWFWYKTF